MAYKRDVDKLSQYARFVNEVTSDPSKDTNNMVESIHINEEQGAHMSRLLTSCIGLSGEVGVGQGVGAFFVIDSILKPKYQNRKKWPFFGENSQPFLELESHTVALPKKWMIMML